ncbi:MAG: N-acetylglucosamine-6-phosphate deacetylase [Ruminococcaceae bacterium]|nr:N-acetylglucosamine-6-phosphate deacetylase [Oscillospiraceae bacterium]
MRTKIENVRTVTADGIETGKRVYIEGDRILDLTAEEIPADRTIDGGGAYLSAGWIDIHTHGAGGADFLDGTAEAFRTAARTHGAHGTTTLIPTTTSVDAERILCTAEAYDAVRDDPSLPSMPGLHLEGPYLAPSQKGAQEDRFIRPFDERETDEILSYSDRILRWTAAPELPGAERFARACLAHGVLPCIGHTDATFSDTERAYRAGFTHVTHLYSCMSTVRRVNAYRVAGVLEAAYYLDGMTAELIADGCHLPPELLRFAFKFKGRENLALVTDSMRAAGMPEGPSVLGAMDNGLPVAVERGVAWLTDRSAFAGSCATMDRLIRTAVSAGIPLTDAVYMATAAPARILNLTDRGALTPGKRADLTLFDDGIRVKRVFVAGRELAGTESN